MKHALRTLFLLAAAMSALTATAIPDIQPCDTYVVYATGIISYTEIANENAPHPVNEASAIRSGTGRCFAKWSSALDYANAGCITTAQDLGNGYYRYYCWKCLGAKGPDIISYDDPIHDALRAAQVAGDTVGGVPINVNRASYAITESKSAEIYEVDVLVDGVVEVVRLDATTGEVISPDGGR